MFVKNSCQLKSMKKLFFFCFVFLESNDPFQDQDSLMKRMFKRTAFIWKRIIF